MDSSRWLLLFFLISIQLISLFTIVQSAKLLTVCSTSNFTVNSTYGNNRNHLFSTINSNSQIDYGFYNVSYGTNSNKVDAIGLCRGDLNPESCRGCINNATGELTGQCSNQKAGLIWYDECMLRYSNRSILGKMELNPRYPLANINNVSNANQFNNVLETLLGNLTTRAASGNSLRKFATGFVNASESQTIYASAQCTPDLSQLECNNCLSNVTAELSECCSGRVGARLLAPSCNIRYETYIFYSTADMPPPPTDAPTPSPADSPTNSPPPPAPTEAPTPTPAPADAPTNGPPPQTDAPTPAPTDAPPPSPADAPTNSPTPPSPADAPASPPPPPANPSQQPNLATRKGNSIFQVVVMAVPLMILLHSVF